MLHKNSHFHSSIANNRYIPFRWYSFKNFSGVELVAAFSIELNNLQLLTFDCIFKFSFEFHRISRREYTRHRFRIFLNLNLLRKFSSVEIWHQAWIDTDNIRVSWNPIEMSNTPYPVGTTHVITVKILPELCMATALQNRFPVAAANNNSTRFGDFLRGRRWLLISSFATRLK